MSLATLATTGLGTLLEIIVISPSSKKSVSRVWLTSSFTSFCFISTSIFSSIVGFILSFITISSSGIFSFSFSNLSSI